MSHLHPLMQEAIDTLSRRVEQDEMDAWKHQQYLQQEQELYDALTECFEKGVSTEALTTLVKETGIKWSPPTKPENK